MTSIFDSDEFNQNLFFPRLDNSAVPNKADDIFVKVESNCKVHARCYKNSEAKFTILFFHGNGEIVSDYNGLAEHFIRFGCEFIVCDFRGYGRSEGVPTLKSTLIDASTIYCYLRENKILKENVCVMGRSLGSASAIELCARFSQITCCIIESGYADPIPLVERRGLKIASITPEENTLFNNSEKIRLVKCPILIMHGELDMLISPEEANLNYKNSSSQIKFLKILKGVGHNDMLMAPNNSYFTSLSIFFAQVVL
jgi:pimeloyl-ACP methyl ester carboxylesterase